MSHNGGMTTTSKMRENVIMKMKMADVHDVEDWRILDAQIKKLTADRDAIIKRFRDRMEADGAHVCMFRSSVLVQRNETHREILDSKRLKAERPEIAAEYMKPSDTWRPVYV